MYWLLTVFIKKLKRKAENQIKINKIVLDSKEIEINKTISYLVLKKVPNFNISYLSCDEGFEIEICIDDVDNSLVDIYFDKINRSFYLTYELGDGKIYREEIARVDSEFCEYNISYNNQIATIKIKKSSINKLTIDQKEISNVKNNSKNIVIIIINVIITIIIAIVTSFILVFKKIKSSNVNRI